MLSVFTSLFKLNDKLELIIVEVEPSIYKQVNWNGLYCWTVTKQTEK